MNKLNYLLRLNLSEAPQGNALPAQNTKVARTVEKGNEPDSLKHEQDIVQRVAKGDRNATRALYGETICRMTSVCSRYVTDPDAVNDVLQESYLTIFTTIDKFQYKGEGSLLAWMTRIVVHKSVDWVKREMRRGATTITDNLPDVCDDNGDDAYTYDVPADVIHDMIRRLPAGYRAVFNMYVLEGMSHKQIATELGIGESSSASQLARAKSWLKREMQAYISQH
ncbi:MAG: RNA polymerase sigma factor [Muribaculaceae bacterium]